MNKSENIDLLKKHQNSVEEHLNYCTEYNIHLPIPCWLWDISSFVYHNIKSLIPKIESFCNIINTHSPDVIFGTESWLKPTILSSEAFLNAYVI